MKKSSFVILLLLVLLIFKFNEDYQDSLKKNYILGGYITSNIDPNDQRILSFTQEGKFYLYEVNNLTDSGIYELIGDGVYHLKSNHLDLHIRSEIDYFYITLPKDQKMFRFDLISRKPIFFGNIPDY